MIEALTILAAAAVLLAIAAAGYFGGGEILFAVAAVIVAGGFLFAFVTGTLYHAELLFSIRTAGRPPRFWWLHPSRHHGLIPERKRRRVMAWYHAGAAGFFITLAGCGLLLLWIILY